MNWSTIKWNNPTSIVMPMFKYGTSDLRFHNYRQMYTPEMLVTLQYFKNYPLLSTTSTIDNVTPYSTVNLSQSDFNNGTVRITKPGRYILSENIIFNPNPNDDFLPTNDQISGGASAVYPVAPFGPYHLGFFAAITIETDNVILDLNSKILRQSDLHNLQQRFYANIELANSPFIVNQGPADFGNVLKSPKNIYIMNGYLGQSSHHGIHGNGMKNVVIENLNIFGFEVAAIALNGGEHCIFRNLQICGVSREVKVLSTYSQGRFIRNSLNLMNTRDPSINLDLNTGNKTIGNIISELNTALDVIKTAISNKTVLPTDGDAAIFTNTSQLYDGNVYGILLNPIGVAVGNFRQNRNGVTGNKYFAIHDCNIEDISSNGTEILGMSLNPATDNPSGPYGASEQVGPVGDVVQIRNIINGNGSYKQNVLTNAQFIIGQSASTNAEKGTTNIKSQIINWAVTGDTNISTLLDGDPLFYINGKDSMGHDMKGNIAFFLSAASNIKVYNITINKMENTGPLGDSTLAPSGYINSYEGSANRGIVITGSDNIEINKVAISNLSSECGISMGIDLMGNSNDVNVNNLKMSDIRSAKYVKAGNSPNPEPIPYFIKKTNLSGDNIEINF